MLGFLKRLFSSAGGAVPDGSLCVDNFSLDTPIRLAKKYETPGGSKVTVVFPTVDIWYSIKGDAITIHRVRLAKEGGSIMGSPRRHNMASKVGEAFYAPQGICDESQLREAVMTDMKKKYSPLRRIMWGIWKGERR